MTRNGGIYNFYQYKTKHNRQKLKILAYVFSCVVVLFLASSLLNKNESVMGKPAAFLLVLDSDANYKTAKEKQSEAEELVSVSYLYNQGGVYYVLGFVYFNEVEATSMLKSAKKVFPKAKILYEKPLKLKKTVRNKLKKERKLLQIFNNLLNVDEKVLELCKISKNKSEEFKIYHEIIKKKLDLQQDYKILEEQENITKKTIKPYFQMLITLIDGCYNSIMVGGEIQKELKILYMKIYFIEKELMVSLNQL